MSKFHGVIGYATSKEIEPGVWVDDIVERWHYGDILQNVKSLQTGDKLVDDFTITNKISIILDSFLNDNLEKIRYIVLMGAKWKTANVEVQRPRIIITTGGLYGNGQ